ncbi:MAG: PAS domain S-box protein [Chloroflexi bacterium]|nr:PAS domain S-box protein [Chloroflexota bacterium]
MTSSFKTPTELPDQFVETLSSRAEENLYGPELAVEKVEQPSPAHSSLVLSHTELQNEVARYKQLEEALRANQKSLELSQVRLQTLYQMSQMINEPEDSIKDFALEASIRITDSKVGYVYFMNEDETILSLYAWSKEVMAQCLVAKPQTEYIVAETGLWGEAIRQRRPIITNDYDLPLPGKKGYPNGHVPIKRHMNVPLLDNDKIILVAGVGNKEEPYTEDDVRQLTLVMETMWRLVNKKRIEVSLRQLSQAVEQSPASIVVTDVRGRIEYANSTFTHVTGYTLEEVLGQNPRFLQSGQTPQTTYTQMWQTITAGQIWQGEFHNRKKNGELFWETASVSPIVASNGQITHYVGVKQNITEQKNLQAQLQKRNNELERILEQLQKTKDRLVQSEKLAAIGELLAGVAHELNNPLAATILYSQLLQKKGVNEEAQRDVDQIVIQTRRASTIVRSLLDFARQRPPERVRTQINQVVKSTIALLEYELRTHNVTVSLELADLPLTQADPHQLQQVFVNLINNSWQAMYQAHGGGHLIIATESGDSQFHNMEGLCLRILVQDNGPGIPSGFKHRIFDPFFTTKAPGEGTGLGLSVCHGIVSEHGGHLWVEDGVNGGVTFIVELPLLALSNPEPEMETHPTENAAASSSDSAILIIDDEQSISLILARILRRQGYSVDIAHDGKMGLAYMNEKSYHLILCDLWMPGMSGTNFYQTMVQRYPQMAHHVIFTTGDTINSSTSAYLNEQGLTYLTKPFELDDLLKAVAQYMS